MKSSLKVLLLTLLSIGILNAGDVELTSSVDNSIKKGDIYTVEHNITNNTSSILVDMTLKMSNQEPYLLNSSSLKSGESLLIKDVRFAKSAGEKSENYILKALNYDITNKTPLFRDDFNFTKSNWGSDCKIQNGVATTRYTQEKGSGVCKKTIDIALERAYSIKLKAKRSNEDVPQTAVVTMQYIDSNSIGVSKLYSRVINATNSLEEIELYIPKAPNSAKKLEINIFTALNSEVTIDDVEVNSYAINSSVEVTKSSNLTYTIFENDNPRTTTASFGDFVWYDRNVNGIQDYGERGIARIRVHLYKDGKDTGELNYTDRNGMYLFENLEPDHNYSIKVDLPRNYKSFTLKDRGNDDSKDSDTDGYGYTQSVFLKAGDNYRDLDSGMVCKCLAWIDIEKFTQDRNGTFRDADRDSGPLLIVGKKVKWKYIISNTSRIKINNIKVVDSKEGEIECPKDFLDANKSMVCYKEGVVKEGNYSNMATVTGVGDNNQSVADEDPSHYYGKKPSCLGDFIWEDKNKNGIQDLNESGIAGAKVELLDENSQSVVDIDGNSVEPIITTSSGEYKFCNLDKGKYIIKVTPPNGYEISPIDQGNDDTKDSDIDPSTHKSTIITLKEGTNDMSWDAGLMPKGSVGNGDHNNTACLGNYMWLDENLNGMQDSDEVGVVGVKVELYDANTNTLLATTTTNSDGKYIFCNLKAGEYKVKFEQPNTYLFTYKDNGNDLFDSDVDSSGWSHTIRLENGEKDMSIDAGIYCECVDYKVNPKNYKKLSADFSLNSAIALLLFLIFAIMTLKYKRE